MSIKQYWIEELDENPYDDNYRYVWTSNPDNYKGSNPLPESAYPTYTHLVEYKDYKKLQDILNMKQVEVKTLQSRVDQLLSLLNGKIE